MPADPTAPDIRKGSLPSLDVANAYYLSMSVQNVRCFGATQVLNFQSAHGTPARWTLILGENGVGKTTLLQLLALGAATEEKVRVPSRDERVVWPLLFDDFTSRDIFRAGQGAARVTYSIVWADSLDTPDGRLRDEAEIEGGERAFAFQPYQENKISIVYGYGANRRRAPRGLTAETSDDPVQTLFDDDATLRNPEEWLLQNELVANAISPLQDKARRQRERVVRTLW